MIILKLVLSSAFFLPSSSTFSQFTSMEDCLAALHEAKKTWAVVDRESQCIDLEKTKQVIKAKKDLLKAQKALRESEGK